MAEQYFTARPTSESRPAEIRISVGERKLTFTTDSGVFSRSGLDAGTKLLIENLPALTEGQRGLDLGCGWGPVGTAWALSSPEAQIVLTDVNERAAALAKKNTAGNGALNTLCVSGDSVENVPGMFDAAALNPPIRTGKENVYRLFRDAMAKLRPGGALYVVIRVKQGADSAKKMLRGTFGNCETIDRGSGYHILRCVKGEKLP
ncbi:MAG: class I SAM-dependent methyltransferase [Clostridia bacterium]|nr:class I SAM-dependent methyltransferase [Clostridia bacterium]